MTFSVAEFPVEYKGGWKHSILKLPCIFVNDFNELTRIKISILLVYWIAKAKPAHLWKLRILGGGGGVGEGCMNREWKSWAFGTLVFNMTMCSTYNCVTCHFQDNYINYFFSLLATHTHSDLYNFLIVNNKDTSIYLNNFLLYFWNITLSFLCKMK